MTAAGGPGAGPLAPAALLLAGSLLLAWAVARFFLPRRPSLRLVAAGAALCLVILIAGCSAGGGGGGSTNTATPPGTYQVGVRGASGGLLSSTTVELVVR
jgi:hypothetical protein